MTATHPRAARAKALRTRIDCWATSRGDALLRFILSEVGTLEVPLSFTVPTECLFLPSTMPRYPRSHDKFYFDGGTNWPDRWLIVVWDRSMCQMGLETSS